MMTKKTRALVAAGAGATVLLASGATFALWSDSGTLNASDIDTGHLELTVGQFAWQDASPDIHNVPIDLPNNFLMVPGDVVIGTSIDAVVDYAGTNLEWEILFADNDLGIIGADGIDNLTVSGEVDDETGVVTVVLDWSGAIGAGAGGTTNGMTQSFVVDGEDAIVVNQVR